MGLFRRPSNEQQKDQATIPEDLEGLLRVLEESRCPHYVRETVRRELDRLAKIHPDTSEYSIGVTYIDYLLSMPWGIQTVDNLDISRAQRILDEDHYGLDHPKERILEYLAVRTLRIQRPFKILVVDDEEIARKNLQHILSKQGYQVLAVENGLSALNAFHSNHFDLVITDLKMERMDGLELMARIKQRHPDVSFILITGYATVDSAVKAMKGGADDYISKPFQLQEVRGSVERALEKKRLQQQIKGPILCLVGPPGTGKTSLGRSIARALERRFVRISLAGIKDEAEIRGHRRTYAGALPGRIIQEIRRARCINPVFMMDEVDKLGQEFKGDPASALLEVLDPEQNHRFMDHYLDVPFDLSKVMFILTANITDTIPAPLLDRMEVLELPGYTDEEKLEIAKRFLIPKAVEESGLEEYPPQFHEDAIYTIIREYTWEAGLRELDRQIFAVCRKIARDFVRPGAKRSPVSIQAHDLPAYLGPRRFHREVAEDRDRIGVTTGLVRRESGGDVIFVEATMMDGKGGLILTGYLGEMMRESAQAALSYILSNCERFSIPKERYHQKDFHVHVPSGAIPKDGPSAGLTIALALLSLLAGRPARRNVALSGEVTLTGRVLPVSGIREKLLAARRAGISHVIFPRKNEVDIQALPDGIRRGITVHLIDDIEEAVDLVLSVPAQGNPREGSG
jgi:ATP-dependent Lon protease